MISILSVCALNIINFYYVFPKSIQLFSKWFLYQMNNKNLKSYESFIIQWSNMIDSEII